VFDGIWVVRISCFKNFLEMVLGRPSVMLEIAFDQCHKLLIRAFNFLLEATVVRHCGGTMRAALLAFFLPLAPFLVPTSTMLGALFGPRQRS
jgi:hypothetical protein